MFTGLNTALKHGIAWKKIFREKYIVTTIYLYMGKTFETSLWSLG